MFSLHPSEFTVHLRNRAGIPFSCYFQSCHNAPYQPVQTQTFSAFEFNLRKIRKSPLPELLPEEGQRVAFCYVPGKRKTAFLKRPVRPVRFLRDFRFTRARMKRKVLLWIHRYTEAMPSVVPVRASFLPLLTKSSEPTAAVNVVVPSVILPSVVLSTLPAS